MSPAAAVALSGVWTSLCAWACPALSEAVRAPDAVILLGVAAALFAGHGALWQALTRRFGELLRRETAGGAKTLAPPLAFAAGFGGLVLFSDTDPGGKVSALALVMFLAFAWGVHAAGLGGLARVSGWERWAALAGAFGYAVALGGGAADRFEMLAAGAGMLLIFGPVLAAAAFRAALAGEGRAKGGA